MSNPYGIDLVAKGMALSAFLETEGTDSVKLSAAIAAYEFARDASVKRGHLTHYPNWLEVRDYLRSCLEDTEEAP